jgi:DNA polymerase epsilon subunit 1
VQPALEFSKQIFNNIFALDEAFSQEANVLKKNLLKIVREKEFAPEVVQGNEPSLILVVPDIICDVC